MSQDLSQREKFTSDALSKFSDGRKVFFVSKESELPSPEEVKTYDAIVCEDVQRFSDIAEYADELANNGKHVFLSSLVCDENEKPFDTKSPIASSLPPLTVNKIVSVMIVKPFRRTSLRIFIDPQ